MQTVKRLTTFCEILGWHQNGARGCGGTCRGNDAGNAAGNSAGDVVRIECTCPCHTGGPRELWPPKIRPMKIAKLQVEAADRHHAHSTQASSRPLSEKYSLIGLAGEIAFAEDFGLERDSRILPGGDGRVDFRVGRYSIDPKAARVPKYLFREVGKKYADILVQGAYQEDESDNCYVVWLGWEFSEALLKEPTKDFGSGILNHYKRASDLRDMQSLRELLRAERAA